MKIDLPTTPEILLQTVVLPAMKKLPSALNNPQANVLLLAIAIQESGLVTRQQIGGPAHGLWQFEVNGVKAVLYNSRSGPLLQAYCSLVGMMLDVNIIYNALLVNDELAAVVARLMLWASPQALAPVGDAEGAWHDYVQCWVPGKPSYARWAGSYNAAIQATGVSTKWQSSLGSNNTSSPMPETSGNGEQSTSTHSSWLSQLFGSILAICKIFFQRKQ